MNQQKFLTVMTLLIFNVAVFGNGDLTGEGTAESPYLIEDIEDFQSFINPENAGAYWAAGVYTTLTVPLDLGETVYTTALIGVDTDPNEFFFSGAAFQGVFDGAEQVISNLTISTAEGNDHLGLFGQVMNGIVKNVVLENVQITSGTGSFLVGGLCGEVQHSDIRNCSVNTEPNGIAAGDENGGGYGGGICGYGHDSNFTDCTFDGAVSGNGSVGGICGYNDGGILTNCWSDSSLQSTGDSVGGICGYSSGIIRQCSTSGSISTGANDVGGICGHLEEGTIEDSTASMLVTGGESVGGVCGYADNGNIYSSVSNGETVSGEYYLGGVCGYIEGGQMGNCSTSSHLVGIGDSCDYVGGAVGYALDTEIYESFAAGDIEGTSRDAVGGFAGYCGSRSVFTCYATGNVTGQNQVGGFVGYNAQMINDCYARGDINGLDAVGGFCGENYLGEIVYCYSTGRPTGSGTIGGFCAVSTSGVDDGNFWDTTTSAANISTMGTGLSTFFMQMPDLYQNAGWLFIETFGDIGIWHMPWQSNGYPMLFYEKDIPGDLTGQYGVDIEDFGLFNQSWLTNSGDDAFDPVCDLEQDNTAGKVALDDAMVLFEHWLTGAH